MATSTDFIEVYDDSAPQELCEELVHWFDACSDNNFTNHNMPFNNRFEFSDIGGDGKTISIDTKKTLLDVQKFISHKR